MNEIQEKKFQILTDVCTSKDGLTWNELTEELNELVEIVKHKNSFYVLNGFINYINQLSDISYQHSSIAENVKDYIESLGIDCSLTTKNEFVIPAVSGSVHQMMAINTFKEMEKQLEILKKDVSFREYIGFEMCMKIFCQRYEKLIIVNSNER